MELGSKVMQKIMDKQWEIIGEKITFKDIPEDGLVEVGKKKVLWYEHYRMTEEQEEKWRKWAKGEMLKEYEEKEIDKVLGKFELLYGLIRKYKKEGELF